MLSLEVRWYGVWDFFKIIHSRGERTSKIREIDEIRLTVDWLLKLGDEYVGAHCTGLSNIWDFYSKNQEKILLKENKAQMVLQVIQI